MVKITNILPRAVVLAAAYVASVNAQLQVTKPSADIWWVAKSDNVVAWTCNSALPNQSTFTILIDNVDTSVQAAPQAIISIANNFDCSLLLTANQVSQNAGTGWRILLADTFNNTNVFATSEPFEIKPLGSAYPTQASPTANATASNTASGSTASNTGKPPSSAMGLKVGAFGAVLSGFAAVAGLIL